MKLQLLFSCSFFISLTIKRVNNIPAKDNLGTVDLK